MTTPEPIPVLTDLSTLEQRVVVATRLGRRVVCSALDVNELAESEDPRHLVRAELIRELLLGRHGDLDPRGVRITGCRITGELQLDHVRAVVGLELNQCAFDHEISVDHATIHFLTLERSALTTLSACGTHVEGSLNLVGTRIRADDKVGAVKLLSARVDGYVDLIEAVITNTRGPAVIADRIRTGGLLLFRNAVIHGVAEIGAVRLSGAHVDGQADFDGSTITNALGCAINADELRVSDTLFLDVAELSSSDMHPALSLYGAHANQGMFISDKLICPNTSRLGRCGLPGRIDLDGFTFANLNKMDWKQWLHLIRFHTDEYRPQPYQHLAAVERAAGHDHNARHILIAQQQDLRRRNPEGLGGRAAQWTHAVWGAVGGYGYRAARLALALFVALALSGTLGWVAGQVTTRPGHQAAERVTTLTTPTGTPCSLIELIGLGIDRGLPLGTTGLRTRCDLDTATRWGQGFTIIIWCIQIAVWALATLAIASYTGLIRKPA